MAVRKLYAALGLLLVVAPDAMGQNVFNETTVLLGSGVGGGHRLGESVALDGDTLLFSSSGSGFTGDEAAYFFRNVSGTWVEEQKLVSNLPGSCAFGSALAVDGARAVVGDPTQDFTGFCSGHGEITPALDQERGWAGQPPILGATSQRSFGAAAAIRGGRMLVGAHGQTTSIGVFASPVVVAYEFDGAQWQQTQVFAGSDTGVFDRFGNAIAMSEDGSTAVIGASKTDAPGGANQAGAAYVFRFDGIDWVEEQKLTAADPSLDDEFGFAVAIGDDVVVVGAPFDDTSFQRAGSVYVFRFDGSQWQQTMNFGSPQPSLNRQYGYSVSIDGSRLAVGEPVADVVHVYRDTAGAYLPLQQLTASPAVGSGAVGRAVQLEGDTCLVGAPFANVVGIDSGAVLLFDLPDLALTVSSTTADVGDVLDIVTKGGVPGTPCTLLLTTQPTSAGGGPFGGASSASTPGSFNPEGIHAIELTVPARASGGEFTLRTVGLFQPGIVGQSNSVTVSVN